VLAGGAHTWRWNRWVVVTLLRGGIALCARWRLHQISGGDAQVLQLIFYGIHLVRSDLF
jgi:hypothetical protein